MKSENVPASENVADDPLQGWVRQRVAPAVVHGGCPATQKIEARPDTRRFADIHEPIERVEGITAAEDERVACASAAADLALIAA